MLTIRTVITLQLIHVTSSPSSLSAIVVGQLRNISAAWSLKRNFYPTSPIASCPGRNLTSGTELMGGFFATIPKIDFGVFGMRSAIIVTRRITCPVARASVLSDYDFYANHFYDTIKNRNHFAVDINQYVAGGEVWQREKKSKNGNQRGQKCPSRNDCWLCAKSNEIKYWLRRHTARNNPEKNLQPSPKWA